MIYKHVSYMTKYVILTTPTRQTRASLADRYFHGRALVVPHTVYQK